MLSGYVSAIGGQLQEAIAFVAIVMVLLIRPQGLFGSRRSSGYDDLARHNQTAAVGCRCGSPRSHRRHRFLQVFGIALLVALAIIGSRTNSFREGQLTQALI